MSILLKCYNRQAQRDVGKSGIDFNKVYCPRPEELRCDLISAPCSYPYYYASLQPLRNDNNRFKQYKKEIYNEIHKLYLEGKNNGVWGRHNPHIKKIEDWIADVAKKEIRKLERYPSENSPSRHIKLFLDNIEFQIGADTLLYHSDTYTLILVEFKGYFRDTNSIRSAILNGLILKHARLKDAPKKVKRKLYYYLGNGWESTDSLIRNKLPVIAPLVQFALKKCYVRGFYTLRYLKEFVNDLNDALADL